MSATPTGVTSTPSLTPTVRDHDPVTDDAVTNPMVLPRTRGAVEYGTEVAGDRRSEHVASATGDFPASGTALTSFRGRRKLLETVRRTLGEKRLVTLTGAGGTGKTRAAAEFASQVRAAFPGGVYSVELLSSRDAPESEHADRVYRAVAHALDVRLQSQGDPLTAIEERITADTRPMLIILDNAEHMRDAVAVLAATLLRMAEHLHILVTSLEMLHVPGEATIEVPPLALPTGTTVDLANEAVSLLVDRAAAVAPGWKITEANWRAVVAVLDGVAGIPLAIELVAARLKSMSIDNIAERMDSIFKLLTGGGRLVPTHHQTLRSTVDWSYNACTPAEQALWARLAVFSGGWTLEAAEQVCGHGTIDSGDVFVHLDGLVGKSIVTTTPDRDRYFFLQPLLIYGLDRLAEAGDVDQVRLRHRDWAAALIADAADTWLGPAELDVMDKAWHDWDNVLAAIGYSLRAEPETETGMSMAVNLLRTRVPFLHGRIPESRTVLRHSIVTTRTPPSPLRASAIGLGAWITLCQGDQAGAATILAEALEMTGGLLDVPMLPPVRFAQGAYRMLSQGEPDSLDMLEEARQGFLAMGSPGDADMAGIIRSIGAAVVAPTEQESLTISREHLARALAHGAPWAIAWSRMAVAMACVRWDHHEEAATLLETSLRAMRDQGDQWGTLWNVETHAWLVAHRTAAAAPDAVPAARRAARLLGAALRLQQFTDVAISGLPPFNALRKLASDRVRGILSTKDFDRHYRDGLRIGAYDTAIALALNEDSITCSDTCHEDESPCSTENPAPVEDDVLTAAEWRVVNLAVTGKTNQEIAKALILGKRTVDSHLSSVYTKLSLPNRVELTRWVHDRQRHRQ